MFQLAEVGHVLDDSYIVSVKYFNIYVLYKFIKKVFIRRTHINWFLEPAGNQMLSKNTKENKLGLTQKLNKRKKKYEKCLFFRHSKEWLYINFGGWRSTNDKVCNEFAYILECTDVTTLLYKLLPTEHSTYLEIRHTLHGGQCTPVLDPDSHGSASMGELQDPEGKKGEIVNCC